LATASDDVERCLGVEMSPGQQQVFQVWQRELWSVARRSDRERLLGCHAISECRDAQDPGLPGPDRCCLLGSQLIGDLPRLTEEMEGAATLLCRLATGPRSETALQEEGEGEEARENGTGGSNWFHGPNEPRPPDYQYGPLTGKQAELAKAICPRAGRVASVRRLHRLSADGVLWTVMRRPQLLEVYFKDLETKAEANNKLIEERNKPKQTRKTQNSTEGE
jgi:hypothetical protein